MWSDAEPTALDTRGDRPEVLLTTICREGLLLGRIFALVILSGSATIAGAQEAGRLSDWSRVQALPAGRKVLLVRQPGSGGKIRGALVTASEQSIVLRDPSGVEQTIPRADIRKVKVRASRAKHTLIGLGIGAGIGLTTGAIAGRGPSESGESALEVTVGTFVGAVLGTTVGALLPVWNGVYIARRAKR